MTQIDYVYDTCSVWWRVKSFVAAAKWNHLVPTHRQNPWSFYDESPVLWHSKSSIGTKIHHVWGWLGSHFLLLHGDLKNIIFQCVHIYIYIYVYIYICIYICIYIYNIYICMYIYIYIMVLDVKVLVRSFNCESRAWYLGNPRE